jgi:hypothetical protein
MPGIGAVFTLPFKSEGWFGTFAIMGLLALIPIVGQINLLGWQLSTLDNYRQGRIDLPPAGLSYIGRGANVFVALLVWVLPAIALFIAAYIVLFVVIAAAGATSGSSSTASAAASGGAVVGILLYYLVIFIVVIYAIAVRVLQPAITIATERGGVRGGISPRNVLAIAGHSWSNTLIAALLTYVSGFLGSLGIYACCVGVIFTIAYSYGVDAGVLRYYEYSLDPQGAPPPTPPPAQPAPYPAP